MPPLRFIATDLTDDPTGRGSLMDYLSGTVTIPLTDSRAAHVQLSMDDPASAYITEGDTAIKAVYGDYLAFHGIVTKPNDDFGTGLLDVDCMDPTVRLKYRMFRYGHESIDNSLDPAPGIPVDGTGLRQILRDATGGGSIPHTHITEGTDSVPTMPTVEYPAGLYVKMERGGQMWAGVTSLTGAASGFDIDWAPIDKQHPGAGWLPGDMVEARTVTYQGVDRRPGNADGNAPVILRYTAEANSVVATPDMESTKNYAVETVPGGQSDPSDTGSKAGAYLHTSWVQYGIWEDWQSSSDDLDPTIRNDVLKNRAMATVQAYGVPPKFVTVTCPSEGPGSYRFPEDVGVGDYVQVYAKRGYRTFGPHDVRIVQVQLIGKGSANAEVQFLCVPYNTSTADILFDDDNPDGSG